MHSKLIAEVSIPEFDAQIVKWIVVEASPSGKRGMQTKIGIRNHDGEIYRVVWSEFEMVTRSFESFLEHIGIETKAPLGDAIKQGFDCVYRPKTPNDDWSNVLVIKWDGA